jgi:hypothetical protein
MKVFLGWSGETSHQVALALHDWLPKVIQSVKPYISSEDIAKGARWATEIARELQTSNYGVMCITSENSSSPWINFEAGALSREIDKSYISPFLFDLGPAEIRGPLALFQAVVNEQQDVFRLLESINGRQEAAQQLEKGLLKEAFEVRWPKLGDDLARIAKEEHRKAAPPKLDLEETLGHLAEAILLQGRNVNELTRVIVGREEKQADRNAETVGLITALARRVEGLHHEIDPFARDLSIYKGLTLATHSGLPNKPQPLTNTPNPQPGSPDASKAEGNQESNSSRKSTHRHVTPPRRKDQ